jgi:hypothetical protein
MSLLRFTARWSVGRTKDMVNAVRLTGRLPRGAFVVFPEEHWYQMIGTAMRSVSEKQKQREDAVRSRDPGAGVIDPAYLLDVTVDYQAKPRTLDQNALMWWLYALLAIIQNQGRRGDHEVTADELYEADMRTLADVYTVEASESDLPRFKGWGWKWQKTVPVEGRPGRITVYLMETSSKWSAPRFSLHIELLFDRVGESGAIPRKTAADVAWWWKRWRQHLNDRGISLHDEVMDPAEYRRRNNYCEGCGRYVGPQGDHKNGRREVHHISSRGSGITWAEEKAAAADWLCLCNFPQDDGTPSCHGVWTAPGGGVDRFLEAYPHNRRKVLAALKRQPDPVDPEEEGQMALDLVGETRTQDYDDAPGKGG